LVPTLGETRPIGPGKKPQNPKNTWRLPLSNPEERTWGKRKRQFLHQSAPLVFATPAEKFLTPHNGGQENGWGPVKPGGWNQGGEGGGENGRGGVRGLRKTRKVGGGIARGLNLIVNWHRGGGKEANENGNICYQRRPCQNLQAKRGAKCLTNNGKTMGAAGIRTHGQRFRSNFTRRNKKEQQGT